MDSRLERQMPFHRSKFAGIPLFVFILCTGSIARAGTRAVEVDWVDQVFKGGLTIWVQFALSIVALAIILERISRLRQNRIVPRGLREKASALWAEKKYGEVVALGHASKSLLGTVIAFVATHRDMGYSELNSACGDIASAGIRKHQQSAYLLAVVATLEPLLGLLGTVIGMIEAFQITAQSGSMGDASLLADSIAKALVTTAVGLVIAIPALGFYHLFRLRAGSLGLMLEKEINELLVAWMKKPVSE
ncbi:MAG: MotA/TolQ/ExbB proton channel family protein [Terrimicrobiaceae bacterium]|jgi:biopolymer transport protein ExbB|nr:MotA/TolQ/ExbB proton channel family protein [Terrimicrobiaceae bacterium]